MTMVRRRMGSSGISAASGIGGVEMLFSAASLTLACHCARSTLARSLSACHDRSDCMCASAASRSRYRSRSVTISSAGDFRELGSPTTPHHRMQGSVHSLVEYGFTRRLPPINEAHVVI